MENKKWTDADLRTAFEDGCKFINFKDLQDFLLERRQNADTSERQLTIPDVIKSVCPKCGSVEVEAMTPRTTYACGSSDYDQRPNTFSQSEQCRLSFS